MPSLHLSAFTINQSKTSVHSYSHRSTNRKRKIVFLLLFVPTPLEVSFFPVFHSKKRYRCGPKCDVLNNRKAPFVLVSKKWEYFGNSEIFLFYCCNFPSASTPQKWLHSTLFSTGSLSKKGNRGMFRMRNIAFEKFGALFPRNDEE